MDNRSIGVFDSGIGGLTVVKEIFKVLPNESITYIGDTARVPYGTRSKKTIIKFSQQLTHFLLKKNVKIIVVACNTASSQAIEQIRKVSSVPVVGIIDPAIKLAIKQTNKKKVGVIGTPGTIKSQTYNQRLKVFSKTHQLIKVACPLFVPAIEEGIDDTRLLNAIFNYHLGKIKSANIDTLILGCTHYPLISQKLNQYFSSKVNLINPGKPVATFLTDYLKGHSLLATSIAPTHHLYCTDNPIHFQNAVKQILGKTTNAKILKTVL